MMRTLLSVSVAALIVAVIYFTVPSVPDTPKGIFLPANTGKPALSPDDVHLFLPGSVPMAYETVGYIHAQLHASQVTGQNQNMLLQYVQQLAAQSGANGIAVILFGHTLPTVPSAQAVYAFQGKAIYYVPNLYSSQLTLQMEIKRKSCHVF